MIYDLLLFPGIPLAYIAMAAIVGGYLYTTKYERYGFWDEPVIGVVCAFFPITLFYYIFIKPITKLGMRLGNWKVEREKARQENLRLIRKQLEETQRELEKANQEVANFLAQEEQYSPAPQHKTSAAQ
jgi:hypothetical protein